MKVLRKGWRGDGALFALLLFSLPAVALLARPGFFESPDSYIHLNRLFALDRAIRAGVLFPRWFPEFAFGYGYPVLNYYAPLSYYFSELFHLLGADIVLSLKLAFGAGLVLSGITMYFFARETLSRRAAALAGLAYVYVPYHLAAVYQRGALAESLAFVFYPLIFLACHRVLTERSRSDVLLLGVSFAGLVLTHNLSVVMLTPFLAGYCLLLLAERRQPLLPQLGRLASAGLIAIGLSAFYWAPVMAESQDVLLHFDPAARAAALDPVFLQDFAPLSALLSPDIIYRYAANAYTPSSHPLGLVQLALALAGLLLFARQARQRGVLRFSVFWAVSAVIALGLTSQVLAIAWYVTQPWFSVLQFPFRFMTIVALGTAYLIGQLSEVGLPGRFWTWMPDLARLPRWAGVAAAGALLMLTSLPNIAPAVVAKSDSDFTVDWMWQRDYAEQDIGATPTAEYLPTGVNEQPWSIPRPLDAPESIQPLGQTPSLLLGPQGYTSYSYAADSAGGFSLVEHAFYFPGWQASIDGKPAPVRASGKLGLVTLDVPSGRHEIAVTFGDTPPRFWGMVVSLASLVALGLAALALRMRTAVLVSLVLTIALAALVAWHMRPFAFTTTPVSRPVVLEDKVELLGYSVDAESGPAIPGGKLQVTLYWLALRPLAQNYKAFVHLASGSGVRAQDDGDPVGGYTPTTRWLPGEVVQDTHYMQLPASLPPGSYTLLAGMYEFGTTRNLAPDEADAAALGNRARLGDITIGARY